MKAYSKLGNKVFVINIRPERKKPQISNLKENSLDVIDIHPPLFSPFKGKRGFGKYVNYLLCLPTISRISEKIIEENKIDYVYSYMPGIGTSFPAMKIKSKHKIKHVLDLADHDVLVRPKILINRSFENADKIITITKYLEQNLTKKGIDKEKIKIIPNGVDFELFNTEKYEKQEILELRNSFNAENLVVFSGALQDLNIIIDAAEIISKNTKKIKFLIVGDHRSPTLSKETWQNKVRKRNLDDYFIFVGAKPHHEVPKYILCGDICIDSFPNKPYFAAAHPLKLLEYGACKKAIVATGVYETKNLIKHGTYGLLAKPNDASEFANHILTLLNDSDLRNKMSNTFHEFVKNNFDWQKIALKLEEFLKS